MWPGRGLISYPIGSSRQRLSFSDAVLEHFWRHRQRRPWALEAGGQLFGRLFGDVVEISEATGPRPRDVRTPWSYAPYRADEQAEIEDWHNAGLIFVGDWHTHWQMRPRPSAQDRINVGDIARRMRHHMNGVVLVIVGYARHPSGLFVSIAENQDLHELTPEVLAEARRRN